MLSIPADFFKDEIRSDFYIPESMKRAWAIQLVVLDEIMSLAKKHNISMWMEYGSLLGAVRHNGYVPWDDDIDICILRKDYMKFLQILKIELPPERKVYSFYTQEDYDLPKAFIACREDIDIGVDESAAAITRKLYGCPYCGGVDIFPLDYIPADANTWNLIHSLYSAAYNLAIDYKKYEADGSLSEYLSELEEVLSTSFDRTGNTRLSLWKTVDAIAMMTTKEEAAYVTWYPEYAMCGDRRKRPLDAYSKTTLVDFEMLKVPIPHDYDTVLKTEYGPEYMTPVKGAAGHNYPYYKEQDYKILWNNRIGQTGDVF